MVVPSTSLESVVNPWDDRRAHWWRGRVDRLFCLCVSIRRGRNIVRRWPIRRRVTGLFGKVRIIREDHRDFTRRRRWRMLVITGRECDYRIFVAEE
jgi:hypothetical protein